MSDWSIGMSLMLKLEAPRGLVETSKQMSKADRVKHDIVIVLRS